MKRNISIQLKATFLLLVFALNTVVGFACAVGLDMDFNSTHHEEAAVEVAVHVHADGKKYEHHDDSQKHQHKKHEDSKKDDCCNDGVIKFQNLDKNLVQNVKVPVIAFDYIALTAVAFSYNYLKVFSVVSQKILPRNFHPPPQDIRIAIRSFQI